MLRLNRFFWSDGEAGIRRYLGAGPALHRAAATSSSCRCATTRAPEQEGDIAAWTRHVREVVRRFGANPRVVALQIANEVNLTISPDSSDGAYDGRARGAGPGRDRRQGRGAAARALTRLEIGFNWAYRTDPASEESFWRSLRDRGGRAFVRALDWIGLDAYPGTVFPPAEATSAATATAWSTR